MKNFKPNTEQKRLRKYLEKLADANLDQIQADMPPSLWHSYEEGVERGEYSSMAEAISNAWFYGNELYKPTQAAKESKRLHAIGAL